MTSSEDFKKALRAGKLSEAFLLAMSNAPELHITTWIASPETSPETNSDSSSHASQPQAGNYWRTHINLIEGKIENEIGEQLIGDRNPEIQQFHLQQVAQGHQTIQQNLESLQKMFHLMSTFQQQQQGLSQGLSWVEVETQSLPPEKDARLEGNMAIGSLGASVTQGRETISTDNNVTTVQSEPSPQAENSTIKVEPKLPAFTQEDHDNDAVVNDLLSLADLDEKTEETESHSAEDEDWGDWLEGDDDPPVGKSILDLNSLKSGN